MGGLPLVVRHVMLAPEMAAERTGTGSYRHASATVTVPTSDVTLRGLTGTTPRMPIFSRDVPRALDHVRRLLGMSTAFVAELVRHTDSGATAPDELVIRYLDGNTH